MAIDIKKFISRFLEEAKDHLSNLNQGVAELEQNFSLDKVNSLFRAAHTLKGSSRMLKLEPITLVAHSLEDLLSALREQSLKMHSDLSSLLYQGLDTLTAQLEELESTGQLQELTPAQQNLCAQLTQVATNKQPEDTDLQAAAATSAEAVPAVAESKQQVAEPASTAALAAVKSLKSSDTLRIKLSKLEEIIRLMGELVAGHETLRSLADTAQKLEKSYSAQDDSDSTLRNFARSIRTAVLEQESLMLELHNETLQMRMLPLSLVLDPATRLVREMARSLNKQVDCRVYGSEIELDRQMIDKLADPIIHLLRNSLDHGVETPAERQAQGKAARGLIQISAQQDSGWVVINISDDGKGLSLEAIGAKALQKKLLTQEELAAMSEPEICDLIFQPGFSTSNLITEVSGRGVGMDVVKRTLVDDLQGVITIHTAANQGTNFSLRLPLSLAKMRILLVKVAQQTLGFTAQYVVELLSLATQDLIQVAERNAVIIRNEFVPVVNLAELINLPVQPHNNLAKSELLLLVVKVNSDKLALVIDELVDERDLIIKQLPEHLHRFPLIAGVVSSGQKMVGLVHVPYLIEQARRLQGTTTQQEASQAKGLSKHILVVDDSLNTREIERDILEAHGYRVTLAEDGQDGLNKAQAQEFDAVLTDVEMPVMDGFSLTANLRALETYADKPIIIITSRAKESDKQRGIQVGASAYIVKGSFDQSSLIDTLNILLG